MRGMSRRSSGLPAFPLLLCAGMLLAAPDLFGQDVPDVTEPWEDVGDASITLKGGWLLTSADGSFPSLLVGDDGATTGDIPAENNRTGAGNRFLLEAEIPIGSRFGISTYIGTSRSVVAYDSTAQHPELRLQIQTFLFGLGGRVDVVDLNEPFVKAGLGGGALYIDGGFSFGFGPMATRVDAIVDADTVEGREEVEGSFLTSDPFRIAVELTGRAGFRVGLDRHIELAVEGGITRPLNRLFSSNAVEESDLTLRHLHLVVGLGYRF